MEHTGKTHGAHREYAMNIGHKNTKIFIFQRNCTMLTSLVQMSRFKVKGQVQRSKVKATCRWKRPHYVIELKKMKSKIGTGKAQGAHRENTGSIQGKHREHTGKTHGAHIEYALNIGHKSYFQRNCTILTQLVQIWRLKVKGQVTGQRSRLHVAGNAHITSLNLKK